MIKNKTISQLINSLCVLPSVGPKSAQRMAYYLLQNHRQQGLDISIALANAMTNIVNCTQCNNFAETPICEICSNHKRLKDKICIVGSPSDVLAIEQSGEYKGLYFVLMGYLSPLDGIGPEQLGIDKLLKIISKLLIKEVIFALNATAEGDATIYFLTQSLKSFDLKISQLAHGIPLGGELEYIDSHTIGKAISSRGALS